MNNRKEFILEVKKFKTLHTKKLKECLNKDKEPHVTRAFFENPIIHSYLSRSVSNIQFSDSHPVLTESLKKDDHDKTDHYELKIYRHLPDLIPYRSESITTPEYYTEGTSTKSKLFFEKKIALLNEESEEIDVQGPFDIYNISSLNALTYLARLFKVDNNTSRFKVVTNWKDTHATTVLTIFDQISSRPLIALLINSSERTEYYRYLKTRIEVKPINISNLAPAIEENYVTNYLNALFSIDINNLLISDSRILISKDNKTALCVNFEQKDFYSTDYENLENNRNIETIYTLYKKQSAYLKNSIKIENPPFVDASHNLQISNDDNNCVLYSINFIEAIIAFLKQPEAAAKIYSLARCVSLKIDASIDAEIELIKLFKEDLKSYLPGYYHADTGKNKTPEEVKDYHVKQRWIMGSQSLSMFYPIKPEKTSDFQMDLSCN